MCLTMALLGVSMIAETWNSLMQPLFDSNVNGGVDDLLFFHFAGSVVLVLSTGGLLLINARLNWFEQ